MEALTDLIVQHKDYAHWLIFGSILLAGLNIPISIDLMMICSALLAAHIMPENIFQIFAFTLSGCLISAWIAYWLGRKLGPRLMRLRFFHATFNEKRLEKSKHFYQKYGLWTFIVGRFIPFGVRNCMFMSSGLSRMSFKKFLLFDGIACTIWATASFTVFYFACANSATLMSNLKTFNIAIFSAFALAVISILWYKKKKKASK